MPVSTLPFPGRVALLLLALCFGLGARAQTALA